MPYSVIIRILNYTFFLSLDLAADSLFFIFLLSFFCAWSRSSLTFLFPFLWLALFHEVPSLTMGTEATASIVGWFLGIVELQIGLLLLSIWFWFWDCWCSKRVLYSGGGFVPVLQYGNVGYIVCPFDGMGLELIFRSFES